MIDFSTLNGKKILITGHTGFKGRWLCLLLRKFGLNVTGLSMHDDFLHESRFLFDELVIPEYFVDLRDAAETKRIIETCQPDIVIHMAAQSLVGDSIEDPAGTISTNVMGFTNLFVGLMAANSEVILLNVTSDKVYRNSENGVSFKETDELGGSDPYSCSKSCVELLSFSLFQTYVLKLQKADMSVFNLRAGNVIGGADFGRNRIIPDIYRSVLTGDALKIRMPDATRPWQHVVEALFGYLTVLTQSISSGESRQFKSFNVGPIHTDHASVENIVVKAGDYFTTLKFEIERGGSAEANILNLDCNKLVSECGWGQVHSENTWFELTFNWYKKFMEGNPAISLMESDIDAFLLSSQSKV